MVAEGDRVRAGGEETLRELRSDADAVGDVLAVDDADRGAELGPQGGQPVLERLAPGPADDVPDEQDVQAQGSDPAAGCTSIATLLPRAGACSASA